MCHQHDNIGTAVHMASTTRLQVHGLAPYIDCGWLKTLTELKIIQLAAAVKIISMLVLP